MTAGEYPPPPWTLRGEAVIALFATDSVAAAREFPPQVEVLPIWPGRTLGGMCLARYGEGSTLTYNELIVFSALVRRRHRIGAWVYRIVVDHPASVAGGRAIWKLPKELAEFARVGQRTTVTRDGVLLCDVEVGEGLPLWRQGFPAPAFGRLTSPPAYLVGKAEGRLELARVRVLAGEGVPFSGRPLAAFRVLNLRLFMPPPRD